MKRTRVLVLSVASAAALTVTVSPSYAAEKMPSQSHSVSVSSSASDDTEVVTPDRKEDICTGEEAADNIHLSSTPGVISVHTWWVAHHCKPGVRAKVTGQLQIYSGGKWRNAGSPGSATVYAGGGSSNWAPVNTTCRGGGAAKWRVKVDVNLIGYADTPGTWKSPTYTVNCTV